MNKFFILKTRKIFSFLIVCLLMITVGKAWGQTTTITIVPNQATTGNMATSYVTSLYSFSAGGIGYSINAWNPSTLQTRGTSTSPQFQFLNTSAIPGDITKITLNTNANTSINTGTNYLNSASIYLAVGSTDQSGTSTAGLTASTAGTGCVYWNVTGNNTFFRIQYASGATTGNCYISSIVIEYATPLCDPAALAFATPIVNQPYSAGTYTQTATSNSGGAITYSSSNQSVATVDPTTGEVTFIKAGTTTISANQTANGNYCAENASYTLNIAYTVTSSVNNSTLGSISQTGNVITATPGSCVTYSSPAYTVTSGTATVVQSNNTFTVTPTSDCNVQIIFLTMPAYTVSFDNEGVWYGEPKSHCNFVTTPAAPTSECATDGWIFSGWKAGSPQIETDPAPTVWGSFVPSLDTTLYAVYSKTASGFGNNTVFLTNTEIGSIATSTTYGNKSIYSSSSGNWTGWFATNNTNSVKHIQLRQNADGTHLASPIFPGAVSQIEIQTCEYGGSSVNSTANGRVFYIMSSSNTIAQPSSTNVEYGSGATTSANGSVIINLTGNPSSFKIYTNGGAGISSIKVTYSLGATTYTSTPCKSVCVVPAPEALEAADTTKNSFTAEWNGTATDYSLNVYTKTFVPNTTVANWTFSTNTGMTPTTASDNNKSKVLSCSFTSTITMTNQGAGGAGDYDRTAADWRNGNGSKYWLITVNTVNFADLKISSKQNGSNTGPKDFKLQYNIGGVWKDIPNGNITVVANSWTAATGRVTDLPLPAECENQKNLRIRWLMNSDNAISGTLGNTGTNRIDDILIKGTETKIIPVAGYPQGVTGSSHEVTGLSPETTYYYTIQAYGEDDCENVLSDESNEIEVITPLCDVATVLGNVSINIVAIVAETTESSLVLTSALVGDCPVDKYGFVYSKSLTVPTIQTGGTQVIATNWDEHNFSKEIIGLDCGEKEYYFRSYVIIGTDTTYSANVVSTITPKCPPVITVNTGIITLEVANPDAGTICKDSTFVISGENLIGTTTINVASDNGSFVINPADEEFLANEVPKTVRFTYCPTGVTTTPDAATFTITYNDGQDDIKTYVFVSGIAAEKCDINAPVALKADEPTGEDKFTANWEEVDDAGLYQLVVYTKKYFELKTLAKWTFPNDDNGANRTAEEPSPNNTGLTVLCNAASNYFTYAGVGTYALDKNNWVNGGGSMCWLISGINTVGFGNLTVSSAQYSSATGPKYFKLQYQVGAGSWKDVSGGDIESITDISEWSGSLKNLLLPTECENKQNISLRWLMKNNVSVRGDAVGRAGTSRIDNIFIEAQVLVLDTVRFDSDPYIDSNSTSEETWGLSPNTTYYYIVKAQGAGGCWSDESNEIEVITGPDINLGVETPQIICTIYTVGNTLVVNAQAGKKIEIFNILGQPITRLIAQEGETRITVPSGFLLVRIAGITTKVVVK